MANDNQLDGESARQTWLTNAIGSTSTTPATGYCAEVTLAASGAVNQLVTTNSNSAAVGTAATSDPRWSQDAGLVIQGLTNEQSRVHGQLCQAVSPLSTAEYNKFGGSLVAQVKTGAQMGF